MDPLPHAALESHLGDSYTRSKHEQGALVLESGITLLRSTWAVTGMQVRRTYKESKWVFLSLLKNKNQQVTIHYKVLSTSR